MLTLINAIIRTYANRYCLYIHLKLNSISLLNYKRNALTVNRERRQTPNGKPRLPVLEETNTVSTQQPTTG